MAPTSRSLPLFEQDFPLVYHVRERVAFNRTWCARCQPAAQNRVGSQATQSTSERRRVLARHQEPKITIAQDLPRTVRGNPSR